MKKHQIYKGTVIDVQFPNKGIVQVQDEDVLALVKNVVSGQEISFRALRKKAGYFHGDLISIDKKANNEIESSCPHFGKCGGCTYSNLSYEDQLKLKDNQMKALFKPVVDELYRNYVDDSLDENSSYFEQIYQGIKASPRYEAYRNKMEFSFGDGCKGGDLELGLHKRGSFYDIVSVKDCRIVDEDYRKILTETHNFFKEKNISFFHKISHEGFLRHLLVRKAAKTGEIMVCLVTSSQGEYEGLVDEWKERILGLSIDGTVAGLLHLINDSLSDVVRSDETRILYGRDYINEEVLGLKFKITPFSFFQTNTYSAEVLYSTARDFITGKDTSRTDGSQDSVELADKTVFDLYSGTGTIAQIIAPVAKKVVGVEIIEEAVEAAKENAVLNGLDNCDFIAGDVLKVLDDIADKPDYIILDPPRDGVHPKALRKIIDYGVDNILYISCKPTSLARDLEMLIGCGYIPKKMCCVDQFPATANVETVCLLSRQKVDGHIDIDLDVEKLESTGGRATYVEIKEYVKDKYGYSIPSLYIALVKEKVGLEKRLNYNLGSGDGRVPQCTPEKEEAILDAFKHFSLI